MTTAIIDRANEGLPLERPRSVDGTVVFVVAGTDRGGFEDAAT